MPAFTSFAADEVKVELKANSVTIGKGEQFNVFDYIADKDKQENTYTFSSDSPSVVKVDANGAAVGVGTGDAKITVTRHYFVEVEPEGDNTQTEGEDPLNEPQQEPKEPELEERTASAVIEVRVYNEPSDLTLSSHNIALPVDYSYKLNYTYNGYSSKGFVFESSNPAVADVDENGWVFTKTAGNAKIYIKAYNGAYDCCNVDVSSTSPGIKITTINNKLQLGATNHKISYSFTGDNIDKSVKLYSSNSSVAKIDSTGKMYGSKTGWVTVTIATAYENLTATQSVQVVDLALSLNRNVCQIALDNSNVTRIQYGKSANGRVLEGYVIVNKKNTKYKKTLFIDFAVHGFEDSYFRDGKKLVQEANKLIEYFAYHSDQLGKYRLVIVPCANPDGTIAGKNNLRACGSAFGRCTAKHVDMNRDFNSFRAVESKKLRSFILKCKPNVYLNMHGWLNETMGNARLSRIINRNLGLPKYVNGYGHASGYVIGWVSRNLGIPAALVEYKSPAKINTKKDIKMIRAIIKA
ncbi:MAG: Ig-like domain-containing protein, partial [Eubacterium sp.]|nr:Ig-like domain-containing protein [Eubacterium sp.]